MIDPHFIRRSYRRFRVGKAHGATGERPKEMDGDDDDEGREQQERDAVRFGMSARATTDSG